MPKVSPNKKTKNSNLQHGSHIPHKPTRLNTHGHTEPHKTNPDISWYSSRISKNCNNAFKIQCMQNVQTWQRSWLRNLAWLHSTVNPPCQCKAPQRMQLWPATETKEEVKEGTHKRMIDNDVVNLCWFHIQLTGLKPAKSKRFVLEQPTILNDHAQNAKTCRRPGK